MRWIFPQVDEAAAAHLANELRVAPLVAPLLVARGLRIGEEAERFLHPSLDHLHSPYKMLGLAAAVERLSAAIARRESILIYGDYDVDGTTAVVILKTAIELCGGSADFHVPHRIREGYGMKDDVIERAAAAGVTLIISVDTGIRAFEAAETARRLGVDLILTDHHLPHTEQGVPRALAVLNPNQTGCEYPCKALCGAGVAFKLAQALLEKNGRSRLLPSFLKMVAIATIADAVPLTGENRVFARLGLEGLRSPANAGLRALMETAGLDGTRRLTAGDVAFRIAPRLNAAGRMDVARDVIELFTVKDTARAREIAFRLNQLNDERQSEERRIVAEIEQQVEATPELRQAFCVVLDGEDWHRGVIGIAATRAVERYNRPALVISRNGDEAHGSGRSIAAFHLLNALESCAELFTRYGGHAHAVGFALPAERIFELRSRMDGYARTQLTEADFEPILEIDGTVELSSITPELFSSLCQLEPFGCGNPEPLFAAAGVRVVFPPKILKDQHLKLRVHQAAAKNGPGFDAMGWRMAERIASEPLLAGDMLDLAFTIDQSANPELAGLQLNICDYRKTASATSAA